MLSLQARLIEYMKGVSRNNKEIEALEILVVDDNEGVITVLDRYLTKQGLRVTTLRDGQAAADLLSSGSHRFDAVLLDVQLPGLNGCEVLGRIRAQDARDGRRTPVLALTGSFDVPERHDFDALLRKPFQFDSLVPRIREAISKAQLRLH